MKGFSKSRSLTGDKGHGHGQVVFTHSGLEIGKGWGFGLWLFFPPVDERLITTLRSIPRIHGVGTADPAALFRNCYRHNPDLLQDRLISL